MINSKCHPGFADEIDTNPSVSPDLVGLGAANTAVTGDSGLASVMSVTIVPLVPSKITEPQLDGYAYGTTTIYGSNFTEAWRYSTGSGVTVGFVDDGFDPATAATFGDFLTSLARFFGGGSSSAIGEPSGGYHGTTTTGLIGATGADNTPEGLAPNAAIVGAKVNFATASVGTLAQAEEYAASVSSVVNNSWGYSGYGQGEPTAPSFAIWYTAVSWAVTSGRGGLGDVITFAAGNDRANANNLALQPITADYRVIAVAASDANGTVASYSNYGAALLVAAIGDNVSTVDTGGSGNTTESGTSYSAPTVAAIAAMMLSVNPGLGWRDVQEILADSAYMPAPSASSFTFNGATDWNGGGMHFSENLGYGVIDANVAVNLARAWTEQSTSANVDVATVSHSAAFTVGKNSTVSTTVADTAKIRVQHVEVTITGTYLPAAWSDIVLISPSGTQSVLIDQAGLVNGTDKTGGLDLSADTITSNAFWGEEAAGTWTVEIQDIHGNTVGTIKSWSLTFIGDNAAIVQTPLVYTPEFASLATAARKVVTPGTATTIDLIALPGKTTINLNGGAGTIDGVAVTVGTGLKNANADGSTGTVTLTGLSKGGSELTGGDGTSTLTGYGDDTINTGFGTSSVQTGTGGSQVTLSGIGTSTVTIGSGGGDTIYAGLSTATVTDNGAKGDTVYGQSAELTFINGSGASVVDEGSGTVTVQGGSGGGIYYAGTGGHSALTAGSGIVTFYGEASGDVLTAAGTGADKLIAGAGSETLSGGTSTGSITLQAGSGSDTLTAGNGQTTFILGSGSSSVTIGGTTDFIDIEATVRGGLNTVTGFKLGADDLHLMGFAASALTTAISGQVSDGHGGTTLTFSNSMRVDLVGITKATASYFA